MRSCYLAANSLAFRARARSWFHLVAVGAAELKHHRSNNSRGEKLGEKCLKNSRELEQILTEQSDG